MTDHRLLSRFDRYVLYKYWILSYYFIVKRMNVIAKKHMFPYRHDMQIKNGHKLPIYYVLLLIMYVLLLLYIITYMHLVKSGYLYVTNRHPIFIYLYRETCIFNIQTHNRYSFSYTLSCQDHLSSKSNRMYSKCPCYQRLDESGSKLSMARYILS